MIHNNYFIYYKDTIIIPKNITHLKTAENFNSAITIPQSVAHIIFGCLYNQPAWRVL